VAARAHKAVSLVALGKIEEALRVIPKFEEKGCRADSGKGKERRSEN